MTEPSVTTPCAFVRPGRVIGRHRPDRDPQSRMVDSSTLWILDRRATSRGVTVEQGVYKLSLPPSHTELAERYTLVYFEPGKLAVYMLDAGP